MAEDQTEYMPERIRRIKARLLLDLVRLQVFVQSQYTFDPSFPFEVVNPRFTVLEVARIRSDADQPQEGQWVPVTATLRVEVQGRFREKDRPHLEMFVMGLTCRTTVELQLLYSGGKYGEVQYQSAVVFRS
jgi:hypothetical protein